MMLEATFHGENERILDAPWHEMQHVAQRATNGLERSTSTIPLNAWGGESGSDLGRAFGFSFFISFPFIFHVLFYFRRKYSPCAIERYTDGIAVSNPKHSLVPMPGARACV